MKIFDLHQDLLMHVRFRDQFGQTDQTSFEAIEESDIDLVVATAFPTPPNDDHTHESVPALITEELEMYQEFIKRNPTWQLVLNAADLEKEGQKILLHLEGLNVFDGSSSAWEQLDAWRNLGVRSISSHWIIQNDLGGGTLQPEEGLTELGKELITYLEKNNVVFDMAHMSRTSFWNAVKVIRRPIYISHGNADAVCNNVRNYTDEQLKVVAETDGVIGVFFPNTFVVGKEKKSTVLDVVMHINYIKNLIGIRHIALGSDFGGIITGCVEGLSHVRDYPNLITALSDAGYTDEEIEQITYRNAKRVLREHLEG
ncbi:dipeptidase [Candidatus Kaiserbacteria bacterium]|nr:dipeptidase [Candidatus Kaiserbacteria bacterium]